MSRRFPLLVRALAGLGMVVLVAQCSSSSALSEVTVGQPEAVETSAVETSAVETSAAATAAVTTEPAGTTSSTIPATTIATIEPTATSVPEPTTTTAPPLVIDPNCPTTPHAAVIDRDRQRAWLCDNGLALPEFVITTAREQPDPGTYPVFAKSMHASSRFGGHYSTMTHFVVFARGEESGARVGFHTVPVLRTGEFAQPLASVGTQMEYGQTSGCIRVPPEHGQVIWDWLQKGDQVHVIT
ncbi:MAG: L,D-transpeptidase [Ilumatobacteraceae bacterium]